MTNRLDGKVAIVTGSASGIGRACAIALATEGAKVYHTDIDEAGGKETEQLITDAGGEAQFAVQDVLDEARWDEVMAEAKSRFGTPNVLVNNAGIAIGGSILEYTLDNWHKQMSVNVDSVFLGTRAAMRTMSEGGSIINMSSVSGMMASLYLSAYGASKAAVRYFTKTAALECAKAKLNIRVNSVHPGIIDTSIWQKSLFDGEARKMISGLGLEPGDPNAPQIMGKAAAPIGRVGEPLDIARTVVFLASDDSAYTTGTELVVDGGRTA